MNSAESSPQAEGHDTLIDIVNATVWRGDNCVFNNLTLSVPLGESAVVLGPNGAGKSTLLKLLTREVYPTVKASSHVHVLGQSRWVVHELRRQLGIVSPDLQANFLPETTGRSVVLSGFAASIGTHGINYRFTPEQLHQTDSTLERLGLAELQHTRFADLSTGQQRRLLLARALVHEPRALVLDEPCTGLDLAGIISLQHTLNDLLRDGVSIVLVTHQVSEIPPAIDRVVLLQAGAIVADGSKHDVLTGPNLSALYGTPIDVHGIGGHFVALPHQP
ncbi:MAG: ATP-binding cassette domain-containing protein [Pseudomonadota bacterium]